MLFQHTFFANKILVSLLEKMLFMVERENHDENTKIIASYYILCYIHFGHRVYNNKMSPQGFSAAVSYDILQ